MHRHDDKEEAGLDCPHCGRGFHTFARLLGSGPALIL
jgi:hypothetical protein